MNTTRLLLTAVFVMVFFAAYGPTSAFGQPNSQASPVGRFIVVFKDDVVSAQGASAEAFGVRRGAVRSEFRAVLRGFAADLNQRELSELRRNPSIAFVEPDLEVSINDQITPTGGDRIQTDFNSTANIDGVSDLMDVDIAVVDTGVDIDHPDLNVAFSVNCIISSPCTEGQGDDDHSHGTHVAGIAAAIDNDFGVVGAAPGARIWAVKVLGSNGLGTLADVIEGLDWITAHNQSAVSEDQIIDVVNMSMGWGGNSAAARLAIQNSVAEGIVYVVSAGNSVFDVYGPDGLVGTSDDAQPASFPEVATISALNDTDGLPGGIGPLSSWAGLDRNGDGVDDGVDDTFLWMSNFSNYVDPSNPVTSPGNAIDLALPGSDIYSTYYGGGYGFKTGTSMASPLAAGLAALYIIEHGRDVNGDTFIDEQDVYAIRQALIDASIAQTDDQGLAVQNDSDGNPEGIGWASDSLASAPTASAGGPYVGDEGSTIVFDGSGSTDSDGGIVTYAWDFDYDGTTFNTQDNGANPQFNYAQDGSYTVALRVIDTDDLASGISTALVTVNNAAPTADAGGPYSIDLGNSVILNAGGSSDPGQDISDYEWDLDDDGQYDDAVGVTYSFTPSVSGDLRVGVKVTDINGDSDTDAATVTVLAPPVLALIDVSPSSANLAPDDTQQFTASLLDQFGLPFTDEVSATTLAEDPALVGNWNLDEGTGAIAGDSSSNNLDGTISGNAQWITGQVGSALTFDGTNDFVTVPYTTDTPQWTVAAWVRSPNAPTSGPASGPVYRDQNFFLNWNHSAASFRGAAGLRIGGQWYPASFGPLSANTWYHLAATYDGETLRAYRDGSLITANTSPSGPPDSENDSLVFGKHSSVAQYFTGDIDEIFVYGRVLTDSEIGSLASVSSSAFESSPFGLAVSSTEEGVTLAWDAPPADTGVSKYRVYRDVVGGGAKALIAEIEGSRLSFVDGRSVPNTTYYYEVAAVDDKDDESPASEEAAVTFEIPVTVNEDPALVGSWKLDEGTGSIAGDSSINGRDGTILGSAQWIAGEVGAALNFDGADDYVSVPFSTDLPQWTVAAWAKSPNPPSTGLASGPVYRDNNLFLNWNHNAAAFRGAAGLRIGGQWYAASFGPLTGDTWYHLAATYDGETLRAYRDGVLITENFAPSGPPDSENDLLVFGRHSGFSSYFEGDIDEILIYSRALSGQEISDLSVAGPSDPTPPTSPAGLTANADGENVELIWAIASDPDTGISAYRIYRDTVGGGTKTLIAEVSGGQLTYTDSTTTPNTTYYYEVSALNGGVPPVEGGLSPEASALTGDDAPDAPTGVTAVGGLGQISLDWDDNSEIDLSHYNIYRSTTSGGPYVSPIASVAGGTSSYIDGGLGNDQTFYYVVTAVDVMANESPIAAQPAWEATGGTINGTGFYTAGPVSGDYVVTASVGEIVGQADVTIDSPNEPPVAVNDAYNVDEDQTLNVAALGVLANDSDPDLDPITAVLVSDVTKGTLNLNTDGSFTYDPDPEYSGPDSFTYVARDTSSVDSNVATVSITVDPVNDAPVAVDDSYSVDENASIFVSAPGILANDSDIELDALTAELVSDVSHGTLTLNPDGSFDYAPDPTYAGPDSFTYVAKDTSGAPSNIATVDITVNDLALGAIHFATGADINIGGLVVGKEDIIEFNGVTFSRYFDGSDVGLTGLTIDSLSIPSATEILLSFAESGSLPDVGAVEPIDVVKFTAVSLGDTTSGTFELYFDGSAAGLSGNIIFAID